MQPSCKKEADTSKYTSICSFVQKEYSRDKPESKEVGFPDGAGWERGRESANGQFHEEGLVL